MVFGTKKIFAIETTLEKGLQASSGVWGRMCIWCSGKAIGDIEEPCCALYPAYQGFVQLKTNINGLHNDAFKGLSDIDIWNLLDGKLFGFHGDIEIEDNRSLEELQSDSLKFNRFIFLTNWGEQFDRGGKSFIYESDKDELKVLNYSYLKKEKTSFSVSKLDVLKAINDFTQWFEVQANF